MHTSAEPLSGNWILQHSLLIAPVAVFAASIRAALALCVAFGTLTFLTALLSKLIPVKLPFSVRTVLYSVIGGLVYIPTALLTNELFPSEKGGIYLPLLCSALYLTAAHDRFLPRRQFLKTLCLQIISSCGVILLLGTVRELFGSGSLLDTPLWKHPPLPMLLTPAGGLILLVLCAAALQSAQGCRKKGESHADRN